MQSGRPQYEMRPELEVEGKSTGVVLPSLPLDDDEGRRERETYVPLNPAKGSG